MWLVLLGSRREPGAKLWAADEAVRPAPGGRRAAKRQVDFLRSYVLLYTSDTRGYVTRWAMPIKG